MLTSGERCARIDGAHLIGAFAEGTRKSVTVTSLDRRYRACCAVCKYLTHHLGCYERGDADERCPTYVVSIDMRAAGRLHRYRN